MKKPRSFTPPIKVSKQQKEAAKKVKPIERRTKKEEEKEEDKQENISVVQILHTPILENLVISEELLKPKKKYKLKITATDIQCIASTDSDKVDDYEIYQSVLYKANNVVKKPISRHMPSVRDGIGKFSSESLIKTAIASDDGFGGQSSPGSEIQRPGSWPGLNTLIYFDNDTQIHVKQGNSRDLKNINNSMVFEISQEELDDKNAKMSFFTRVIERNSTFFKISSLINHPDIHYNYDGYETTIAIYDVLRILTGKREYYATKPYFDGAIAKNVEFDVFDGINMALTKVDYPDKTILEGPIRARGKTAANKAALWIRFELID